MRDAAPLALPALVVLYWAFRTGLHWHEPDKLAAFWGLHGIAAVVVVLAYFLWRGVCALYGRLVLRFEKGRAWERAYVVAHLRQRAQEYRGMARHTPEQHHAFEEAEIALENSVRDIAARHHHPQGGRP